MGPTALLKRLIEATHNGSDVSCRSAHGNVAVRTAIFATRRGA